MAIAGTAVVVGFVYQIYYGHEEQTIEACNYLRRARGAFNEFENCAK